MMKKQAYNPYLPIHEYIPDGEPHVFDGRAYIFGSHDREGGYTFCMDDYVTYSADVKDLTDWKYEGVIYKASQDPDYPAKKYMYAPDVVKGNDGKYYLYYGMSGDYGVGGYTGTIHVAVSDSPAGPYEYHGEVHFADGTPMWKYVCFDPGVINDNGVIRLYYGTQYNFEEVNIDFDTNEELISQEMDMFGRSRDEILAYRQDRDSCLNANPEDPDSVMGPITLTLEDDMLTVKEAPKRIIPYRVKGTEFEEHPFFEAPSMRKVGNKYYFIYSSFQNHELCYAISDYPDRDFKFGGTIVSNGDIGFNGRSEADKHNMTGTTHGSIIEIEGQWYVFYHRLTHKSDYSRQACAEKIQIAADGSIKQVEITSCGLNPGALVTQAGTVYPATIACIITNGRMPHGCNSIYQVAFPNVTHKKRVDESGNEITDRLIAEIEDGTLIGYKYFDYSNTSAVKITARIETEKNKVVYDGPLRVDVRSNSAAPEEAMADSNSTGERYFEVRIIEDGLVVGKILINDNEEWTEYEGQVKIPDGINGLFLTYRGTGRVQLLNIQF